MKKILFFVCFLCLCAIQPIQAQQAQIPSAGLSQNGFSNITQAYSGAPFNLVLTNLGCNCPNQTLTITYNNVVVFQGNSLLPLTTPTPGTLQVDFAALQNSNNCNGAMQYTLPFIFPAGITCDGASATFNIQYSGCGVNHTQTLAVKARTLNLWKASKEPVAPTACAGENILWRVKIFKDFTNVSAINGITPSISNNIGTYDLVLTDFADQITTTCTNVTNSLGTFSAGVNGYTPPVYFNPNTPNPPFIPLPSNSSQSVNLNSPQTITANTIYMFIRTQAFTCNNSCTLNNSIQLNGVLGSLNNPCGNVTLNAQSQQSAQVNYCGSTLTQQGALTKSIQFQPFTQLSPGCSGRYIISFTNTGNVPITQLTITDPFPTGLTYINHVISPANAGVLNTGSSPFQFNMTQSSLAPNASIFIEINFQVNTVVSPGTLITNCATANFNANIPINPGNDFCGNPVQTVVSNTAQGCVQFNVKQPSPLVSIKKCVTGPSAVAVGGQQSFAIFIANNGDQAFNGTLTDPIAAHNLSNIQNVQVFAGTVPNIQSVNYGSCGFLNSPSVQNHLQPLTAPTNGFSVTTSVSNTALTANLTIPPNCNFMQTNVVMITFTATQMPASMGTNLATVTLGAGQTISSQVPYNILAMAALNGEKQVNSGINQSNWSNSQIVPVGGTFQYRIRISNVGSLPLSKIQVQDNLPSCVQLANPANITVVDANNNTVASALPVSFSGGVFVLPAGFTLNPGQDVFLVFNAQRTAATPEPCVNCATVSAVSPLSANPLTWNTGCANILQPLDCQNEACKELKVEIKPGLVMSNGNVQPMLLQLSYPVPIQELSIHVDDFFIQYLPGDCKPANIGNAVGHMATASSPIGGANGLLLQQPHPPMNTSLTWIGNPTSVNTGFGILSGIPFNLSLPNILNLKCCEGRMNICFTVRIKDVNCVVCEKRICRELKFPSAVIVTPSPLPNINQKQ
ncbi:DUF11 domain-containing protein [Rhodoflexus caldus]|uniref:DUF11 domain-containing protein n=1 Tax=Rhodoflexus caldus TaxID=2891236 RepID=UPI00202AAA21|nr:DUF11 domain-containing protein [Rhodoflexus caldus]